MSNTILTPVMITREAQRVLHQKANFIGSINRGYDNRYAQDGAKIGDALKIRLPNQYTVRTGAALVAQDTTEESVTLTVNNQKGVDLNFTSTDLTMSLDDFSDRIIEPAISVLAANIEYDAMSMYKDVYQTEYNAGSAMTFAHIQSGRTRLNNALAPLTKRTANLSTQQMADLVTDTKGLFNDAGAIGAQYKEGFAKRVAGFDFYENTLWPRHARGSADGAYVCNTSSGITSGTATIAVTTGTGTFADGDVITVAGVTRVHPETKADTGVLQQFVVTTASAGGSVSLAVSPTPITSGARQNITITSAGASKAVVISGTASGTDDTGMLYQRDAFAFATADLQMPRGVDMAARELMDGISMRLVRQYDINSDKFPCRLDILYGYQTIRAQLATRVHNN